MITDEQKKEQRKLIDDFYWGGTALEVLGIAYDSNPEYMNKHMDEATDWMQTRIESWKRLQNVIQGEST